MTEPQYPANPADAALRLFLRWFGRNYARAVSVREKEAADYGLRAGLTVGRQWSLEVAVADTLTPDSELEWEAARAAIEQRLDAGGQSLALWVPRGAPLPTQEPELSQLIAAAELAPDLGDGRKELRRRVRLYLRRTSTTGSVITVLGGLAASWAQFTNRVPGSFQLNSTELFRLPNQPEEREELAERIVMAAGQPDVDDSTVLPAEDVWTLNDLEEGGSCVLGTPKPDNDEQSAALRRNLRTLLRSARSVLGQQADAKALVVLGSATYADEEKLSWALRGMDPTLYSGYDIIAVVADGAVKLLLQPGRSQLPWDAPLR